MFGHERERHERARLLVRVSERSEIEIGERVAVDEKERVGADDVERLARTAGAAENRRLLPRIADVGAKIAAVTDAPPSTCAAGNAG